MTRRSKIVLAIVALVVAAAAVGVAIKKHSDQASATTQPAEETKPVATVSTTPLVVGQISQTITAYGNVMAEPGVISVLSVAVESRVKMIHVAVGEAVSKGAAVIEVEPSPDAKLQLIDAKNALEGAKKDATNTKQRFDLKLATTAESEQADRAVQSAQAKLDDLLKRGAGEESRTIKADVDGMIAKVDVQEGQLVPAGGALLEVVPKGQIEIRLGVEPAQANLLRKDQFVEITPSTADEDAEPIAAKVRLATRRINPDSRLVDVFVIPSETDELLLDSFVRGEITTRTVSGLVVPHDALLPDDAGFVIFTAVDGHAAKKSVKVILQNDKQALITGDGLHEGDAVVTTGALELDDGTAISVAAPTTAPAAEDEK